VSLFCEDIPSVDTKTIIPMEIAHDLNEGVIPKTNELIVTSLHKNHGIEQEVLTTAFEIFSYYEGKPGFDWKYGVTKN